MFEASIEVKDQGLIDAYQDLLTHTPQVAQKAVDQVVNKNADAFLMDIRKEPGPVKYPIKWKSEKQRRAFFATDGFGQGIPTKRTRKLPDGWRMQVIYESAVITSIVALNPVSYRRFVTGNDQQPFHANTGWRKDEDVLSQWSAKLADDVETELIILYYSPKLSGGSSL